MAGTDTLLYDCKKAIRSNFNTLIVVANTMQAKTQWPNVDFTPPDNAVWMRLAILFANTRQRTLGDPSTDRAEGVMIVSIFSPAGQGDKEATVLADKVGKVFRKATLDGVRFRVPTERAAPRSENWDQINVECPFFFDAVTG